MFNVSIQSCVNINTVIFEVLITLSCVGNQCSSCLKSQFEWILNITAILQTFPTFLPNCALVNIVRTANFSQMPIKYKFMVAIKQKMTVDNLQFYGIKI